MTFINFSKIDINNTRVSELLYGTPRYAFGYISPISLYLDIELTRENTRIIFFRIYDMLI